eukprot:TRINITY_DN4138_c0_g2_i1.p1 TRINITY_DN4138_c0_g2~~TRINITY_DN4138_c0_g2_i1.p1  ORF type:complete len:254 (+),score=20.69 TRINITY_DN4138_c0_g2_i1:189-950(+)
MAPLRRSRAASSGSIREVTGSRVDEVNEDGGSRLLGMLAFGCSSLRGSQTLPPLADSVATFAGPRACARLAAAGRLCRQLTLLALTTRRRRSWVRERWPVDVTSDLLTSYRWPRDKVAAAAYLDEAWMLVEQAPHLLTCLDKRGFSPLHVAARHECVSLCSILLSARSDPNLSASGSGWTPLHCAAAAGDADCTSMLLAAAADPEHQDDMRRVPLELAVRRKSGLVQEVLLNRMEESSFNCLGGSSRSSCAVA